MPVVIHLSFDQDWAPAWATLDVDRRLREAGVSGTLFATQLCAALPRLRESEDGLGLVEIGWHPNFLPGSSHGETQTQVLDFMTRLVPEAVGVRAHCLVRSTPLLIDYGDRGLLYDSSDLMDGQPDLHPLVTWNGVVRLPIFWEDDVHLRHGRRCRFEDLEIPERGLCIFNFHPVLLALNAANLAPYEALKSTLAAAGTKLTDATPDDLAPYIERDHSGVSDLLDVVLSHLRQHAWRRGGPLRDAARAAHNLRRR